jgi:hypothetical protein
LFVVFIFSADALASVGGFRLRPQENDRVTNPQGDGSHVCSGCFFLIENISGIERVAVAMIFSIDTVDDRHRRYGIAAIMVLAPRIMRGKLPQRSGSTPPKTAAFEQY